MRLTRVQQAPGLTEGTGEDPAPLPADALDLGSLESFEAFYRRELPYLVALARALSGSAWADDIAQEAMLAAYRQWDRVSRFDAPTAWVRQVCANKAVSLVRRRGTEARALLRLSVRREPPATLSEPTEEFWADVRRLPRRQAQAVALFYVYDLGVAEIAETLACSEGTVKTHLSRGRAALAARWSDLGGETA